MNKNILTLFLLIFCVSLSAQRRPEIGLTLSGGGAKGLAHIGLLQAIDSAGLKIDFLTGTSMGSIVGSLYAIGYSGKDIEAIAGEIDWAAVLTNRSPLYRISMEEKPEYGKYALELPVVNKKVQIPSGVLKGQELWTTLSELYFPVHSTDDFYEFDIPFKCVATDVVTGKEVVMDCGSITRAVRASMAIPMVFTSVDTLNYRLVDGGIVRNFPVKDVVEMGADYVIGSSVSSGLVPEEELNNVVDIILQIVFLKEGDDYGEEVELCDYFIQMPIEDFSTGSFDKASEIIAVGKEHAFKTAYPYFKHLADSLNQLYPSEWKENRLPELDSVLLSEVEIKGLNGWEKSFFLDLIDFQPYTYYHPDELSELVRKAYGTRFYSQVSYQLETEPNGPTKIIFTAEENARTQLKFGVHYTEFSGISALFNITKRDFLFHNSRSFIKLNVGENIRLRAEHLQYLGKKKNLAFIPSVDYNMLDFTVFDGYDPDGVQRLRQVRSEMRFQHVGDLKHATGFGARHDWGRIIPTLNSKLDIRGENNFLSLFAYHQINTMDRQFFPRKGLKLYAEGAYVTGQNPSIRFFQEDTEVPQPSDIDIADAAYARFYLDADLFVPFSKNLNLILTSQTGMNFNNKLNVLNNFRIGGLSQNSLFYNQINFSGLTENTKNVASASAFSAAFRYAWRPNIYLSAQSNIGVYDFLPSSTNQSKKLPFLGGHSISVAYDSPIGPISLTGTYSNESQALGYFVNLGIGFY